MYIFDVSVESFFYIIIRLNWVAIIILGVALIAMLRFIKNRNIISKKRSIEIQEVTLGIGSNSVTLHYDNKDRTIAYKLWIELNTRKIGLEFDKDNDVITEVYNSWYEYFQVARELIKDLPIEKIECAAQLIELTTKVLNDGLRPHLTKWQARFRKWYDNAIRESDSKLAPQEIQKNYPYYNELIIDLIETNKKMMAYKELMYKIAFNK